MAAFTMPYYTGQLIKMLEKESDILVGGVVGFPSGAETTSMKVSMAKEMLALGCDELDMVINIGALKSGMYEAVAYDIQAVVEAAGALPVKAILEIAYLSDDEIIKGSEIAVKAGVKYIKTGTGWATRPTTVDTIKLIKRTIGDSAKIKAAGGVRDLKTLLDMAEAGCSRFGVGLSSAISIMDEVDQILGI